MVLFCRASEDLLVLMFDNIRQSNRWGCGNRCKYTLWWRSVFPRQLYPLSLTVAWQREKRNCAVLLLKKLSMGFSFSEQDKLGTGPRFASAFTMLSERGFATLLGVGAISSQKVLPHFPGRVVWFVQFLTLFSNDTTMSQRKRTCSLKKESSVESDGSFSPDSGGGQSLIFWVTVKIQRSLEVMRTTRTLSKKRLCKCV